MDDEALSLVADTETLGSAATPADDGSDDEASAREPATLEEAAGWLANIKPSPLLALLRDPEFALVSMTAFAGFRVNPTGYANPLVRARLAREAVRDNKFADKLRSLAEKKPDPGLTHSGSPTPPTMMGEGPATPKGTASRVVDESKTESEHRLAVLRAERDQRRRERNEARQALADSEIARVEAERLQHRREAERDEFHAQAQRQAHRIARLERQVAKLQAEQTSLLRTLRQQQMASAPTASLPREDDLQPNSSNKPDDRPNFWLAAVEHLLDKRRYDLALSLAEDVLRADSDNLGALHIAAQAHEGKDDAPGAVPFLRRLLLAARPQYGVDAAETLRRLLLTASATEIERDLRHFLPLLHSDDRRQIEPIRAMLTRLRGMAPDTHTHVAALIARFAPASLVDALLPPPGQLGPDDPLPLSPAWTPSARNLIFAVLAGDTDTVGRAQDALTRLSQVSPEIGQRVQAALMRAAGDETSVLTPLLRTKSHGPVVVDGSNAAWHGQDTLTTARPRLRPLLELRRALLARGYFPVRIFGDAPLPYTIDEPEMLRRMVEREEIVLVDSGVDADEVLLREAKRADAPLVTNDYMTDWDPKGEVEKIRYTFSLHGEVYLT